MIEESALVLEVYDQEVLVEVQANAACDSCQAKGVCGQGLLSKYFNQNPGQLLLKKTLVTGEKLTLKPGEQILIGVEEGAVLQGAFFAYLIPLLFVLAFAAMAQVLGIESEFIQLVFIGSGLFFGVSAVKILVRFNVIALKNILPVILKSIVNDQRIPTINQV